MNIKFTLRGLAALLFAGFAVPASANLVSNGSFESTSLTGSGLVTNSDLTDWTTTSGYTFEVFPGTATTTGIGSGVNFYGGTSFPNTSPDGGKYIASDGAYETGTLSQTLSGLVVGGIYAVSFYQAGAQQTGYTGVTTDQWKVSLGSQIQYSTLLTDASQSFVPWQAQTLYFTATATSEVLGFMAVGTPSGEPPFSLLDGVAVNKVAAAPEPASWALMIAGLLTIAAMRKWHRGKARNAAE